jgi:hypothetical protein
MYFPKSENYVVTSRVSKFSKNILDMDFYILKGTKYHEEKEKASL